MEGKYYSKRGSDENGEKSEGISWTTFKRSPNKSKNGYFLCKNCGFEIIHATQLDMDFKEEIVFYNNFLRNGYVALHQGITLREINLKVHRQETSWLKCQNCEECVYCFVRDGRNIDTVTERIWLRLTDLVYENDSLSCKNCRCVDKGDSSTTSTYKKQCFSGAILLKPIQNDYGKFYDVKSFNQVKNENRCQKCDSASCRNYVMDIFCFQCNALVGLKFVSREENEELFVGYILQNLNPYDAVEELTEQSAKIQLGNDFKDDMTFSSSDSATSTSLQQHEHLLTGMFSNDPSEAKLPVVYDNIQKEKLSYVETDLPCLPFNKTKEPSTKPALRGAFEEYRMEKKKDKIGWCLIINNMDFNISKYREGSDKDEVRLHEVFDRLKFKIDSQNNMRGGDMYSILEEYANKDHTDMDCFVCCILSHGNKDGVVSCDEKCVSIDTLTSYFRASSCPSLAGKPKLFFFQACKGIVHMDGCETDCHNVQDRERTLTVGSVPDEADFLLGFATTSGYVSYRRHDKTGSVYIQTLCDLLEKYASKYDLLSIMTVLHQKVAEEVYKPKGLNKKTKQMPTTLHRLTKQLYFKK